MKDNVGKIDEIIRILIGIIIVAIGFFNYIMWLPFVAVFPFVTGFSNYCPIYSLFKINTKIKRK